MRYFGTRQTHGEGTFNTLARLPLEQRNDRSHGEIKTESLRNSIYTQYCIYIQQLDSRLLTINTSQIKVGRHLQNKQCLRLFLSLGRWSR